ncbi:MAG: cysteine desulfurase [Clostridia bacterium]|nr:cysteine desulfurase [Clostridia bacterium]
MIYFDNAASTPLSPRVKEVLFGELEHFANPSSLHSLGFEAEKRLKHAREQVARTLSARPDEIFFCSGGTEADNLGILGAAAKGRRMGNRILSTDSEHPATEECLRRLESEGFEVIRLSTRHGALDPDEIAEAANEKTILAAVMHTNNETGAVYDVAAVSRIVKGKNPRALVFCDGVQGYCKTPILPQRMGIDLMSLSSHKIHGPKGVGALWVKKGIQLPPLILGGGQEGGLRSGTENLPGIVAFGAAAEESFGALPAAAESMGAIRERIKALLASDGRVRINEAKSPSCHLLSLQVPAFRSEVLLHALSAKGVFVSSGSACSSHKGKSPVLKHFGLTDKEADCTVRLSFSRFNTLSEADEFVRILKEILR